MEKRQLPRHVDGRIMIGKIHIKKLIIILPFVIAIAVITIKMVSEYNSKVIFAIGVFFEAMLFASVSEINNRETRLDLLKDRIKYIKEGTLYWERSCKDVSEYQKIIKNNIKEEK